MPSGIATRGNTVEGVCRNPTREECKSAISVLSSRDIRVEGNAAEKGRQGPGCEEAFRLGAGCDQATTVVEGNTGF